MFRQLPYAITRYRSTNAGRNDIGLNLVVLRKIKDQWLIVAHEAAVPDPATAVQRLREPSQAAEKVLFRRRNGKGTNLFVP
jgi:hypothetical protein